MAEVNLQTELLNVPWFLDAKNPENIARREKLRADRKAIEDKPKRRFGAIATKPAKSVETDFTRKDVEPKAAAVKPVKADKPKGRKSVASGMGDKVIRVLTTDFGHKAGSKAETKSNGFRDGMTVAEYMANDLGIAGKWHMSHINHCLGKGFIKIED